MNVAQARPAVSGAPLVPISIAELRQRAEAGAAPSWIVAPFLPDVGVVIVGGAPKSGKTYLTLGMLVAASAGVPFAGYFPTRRGRFLFVEAEGTSRGFARRLDVVAHGLGLQDAAHLDMGVCAPEVLRTTGFRLDSADSINWLGHFCDSANVRAVVLDPIRRLSGLDENDARAVSRLIEPLSNLAGQLRLAVILLHHTRKPTGRTGAVGAADLRGSGDWSAAADSILTVDRRDDVLRINAAHRESEDESFRLRVEFGYSSSSAQGHNPGFMPVDLSGVVPAGAAPMFHPRPPPWSVRFTVDPAATAPATVGASSAEQDAAIRGVLSHPGSPNLSFKEARERVRSARIRASNRDIDRVFREVREAAGTGEDSL